MALVKGEAEGSRIKVGVPQTMVQILQVLASTTGVPEQRLPVLAINGQAGTSLFPLCSMSGSA